MARRWRWVWSASLRGVWPALENRWALSYRVVNPIAWLPACWCPPTLAPTIAGGGVGLCSHNVSRPLCPQPRVSSAACGHRSKLGLTAGRDMRGVVPCLCRLVVNVVGALYPGYQSYKTIKEKNVPEYVSRRGLTLSPFLWIAPNPHPNPPPFPLVSTNELLGCFTVQSSATR